MDAAVVVEGEAAAFWSEDEQRQAIARTNEAKSKKFVTPFFNKVLAKFDLVFVNSENYPWLPQSQSSVILGTRTYIKPDGFATHRGMFRQEGGHRSDGFRFGIPKKELLDCLILFESTLDISDRAFGPVVRYLQYFCPDASARAILFDTISFWMIKSYKGVITRVEKAKWANRGSKSLFQKFINDSMSPWISRLADACHQLDVDVVEGEAFLGRGARGRVFKVKRGEEIFALKIADEDAAAFLDEGARALTKAELTGLTIKPMGECIGLTDGAAVLLTPVGKPLTRHGKM